MPGKFNKIQYRQMLACLSCKTDTRLALMFIATNFNLRYSVVSVVLSEGHAKSCILLWQVAAVVLEMPNSVLAMDSIFIYYHGSQFVYIFYKFVIKLLLVMQEIIVVSLFSLRIVLIRIGNNKYTVHYSKNSNLTPKNY